MQLYHSPFSSNARKVRMTAMLLGIDLELVHVDIAKGEQRKPEFLALNPMGRVPVLKDGDFVLPESAAIMMYLAATKPGSTIYPTDPRQRANVDRWLYWAANHWSPAVAALTFENMLKKVLGAGEPEPVQVKRQEDVVRHLGTVLDAHLGSPGREWVAGGALTIADIAIAPSLMFAIPAKLPVQSLANVRSWLQRLQGLDAWKKTEPPAFPGAS